jgi:hypothetical protein
MVKNSLCIFVALFLFADYEPMGSATRTGHGESSSSSRATAVNAGPSQPCRGAPKQRGAPKRRGRPPGSKNVRMRMRMRTIPEEVSTDAQTSDEDEGELLHFMKYS